MAGKRTATSDLNHTNWNQEDDPEDSGNFTKAADDIIKNRVIKVAKRRNPIGTLAAAEGDKKNAFVNFGGFPKTPLSTQSSVSPYGFLTSLNSKSEEQPKTNGLSDGSTGVKTSSAVFKEPESKTVQPPFSSSKAYSSKKSREYYAKIKGLNQSVSNWIKKHVDANPFLNLTPVFRDYEKYLDEIENAYKEDEKGQLSQFTHQVTEVKTVTSNTKTETHKEISSFTFKPSSANKSLTSVFSNTSTTSTKLLETSELPENTKTQNFSFSTSSYTTSTSTAPTFSFGKPNVDSSAPTAGFSFGKDTDKPFAFSNVTKPENAEDSKGENGDEEDEPPKVEFTPVVEEGHVYTIRCKVFVKKDGKFGDRGVGNLFLKPVPNSDKIQLIVRADTSLGNLLCNFILSKSIPMQRMGKKDVMLACLPTPDSKPPPVPVLFRVKSSEEADELLRILEKHKM